MHKIKNDSLVLVWLSASLLLGACDQDRHDQPTVATAAPTPVAPQAARMSMHPITARISAITEKKTDCNIENANGAGFDPGIPSVSTSEIVAVSGWLIDKAAGGVPIDAVVRIESQDGSSAWEQAITTWGDRGDIVSAHDNNPAFLKSGFSVPLELGELKPGPYNIYLAYGPVDKQATCAVGRRIDIK